MTHTTTPASVCGQPSKEQCWLPLRRSLCCLQHQRTALPPQQATHRTTRLTNQHPPHHQNLFTNNLATVAGAVLLVFGSVPKASPHMGLSGHNAYVAVTNCHIEVCPSPPANSSHHWSQPMTVCVCAFGACPQHNRAAYGGVAAVSAKGHVKLDSCRVAFNSAATAGSVLATQGTDATMELERCRCNNNELGAMSVSVITPGSATGALEGQGGAVWVGHDAATVAIKHTTLMGTAVDQPLFSPDGTMLSVAAEAGGLVSCQLPSANGRWSTVTIEDSVLSHAIAGRGGCVAVMQGCVVSLKRTQLVACYANYGGALFVDQGSTSTVLQHVQVPSHSSVYVVESLTLPVSPLHNSSSRRTLLLVAPSLSWPWHNRHPPQTQS